MPVLRSVHTPWWWWWWWRRRVLQVHGLLRAGRVLAAARVARPQGGARHGDLDARAGARRRPLLVERAAAADGRLRDGRRALLPRRPGARPPLALVLAASPLPQGRRAQRSRHCAHRCSSPATCCSASTATPSPTTAPSSSTPPPAAPPPRRPRRPRCPRPPPPPARCSSRPATPLRPRPAAPPPPQRRCCQRPPPLTLPLPPPPPARPPRTRSPSPSRGPSRRPPRHR